MMLIEKRTAGRDLGFHLRELELRVLEVHEPATEELTAADVLHRHRECRLGRTLGSRADLHAIERDHGLKHLQSLPSRPSS